jgi:hypothetical protein
MKEASLKGRENYGFNGTDAPVWVWPKVVWLDRANIGDESLMDLKFLLRHLIIIKHQHENET